jgi:hypothetical protein
METVYGGRKDGRGKLLKIFLFVFIAFCGAVCYYLFVNMSSFVAKNPKKLELYYRQAKRFTPQKKAEFLKNHAGLWSCRCDTVIEEMPLLRSDLLELKDNGIVWEVINWDVVMPSGGTKSFFQIRTGYVEPYGTLKGDTLGDFFTIHQCFIAGSDTCFGGWNFLDLWVLGRDGESLVVAKRKFTPYSGAPTEFFPRGMIDLVGLGGGSDNQAYKKIGKGSYGAQIELKTSVKGIKTVKADSAGPRSNPLQMPDCLDLYTLGDALKKALAADISDHRLRCPTADSVERFIVRYSEPLFLDEQMRMFPRPLPRTVTAVLSIKPDGTLDDVQLPASGELDKMLRIEFLRTVKSWRFPPTDRPITLTHTFSMP